jgi:flagellar basal-body rod protein FlgB
MVSALNQFFDYRQKVMNLHANRQQVLATNIANADTPNFKARDIDFASALKRVQSGEGGFSMSRTQAAHLEPSSGSIAGSLTKFRAAVQPSIDGNTVDMNVEMARFTDNAIRYQADIGFMQSQIAGLKSAISGQ